MGTKTQRVIQQVTNSINHMVFRWFFNDQTIGTCAPYNVDFQYKIRTVLGTFLPILISSGAVWWFWRGSLKYEQFPDR